MTSAAVKSASEAMSNPPAFSYAQAARGETVVALPAAAPNPENSNSAAPSTSSLAKEDSASTTTNNTAASAAASSVVSDMQELPKALQESIDLSNLKNIDSELSSVVGSVRSNGAAAGPRDDSVSAAGSQSQNGEKTTGRSGSTSRAADSSDARKSRKGGKKSKSSDKGGGDQDVNKENLKTFEAPAPKVELTEAPIPPVNIWHQRRDERAAATAKRATSLPKTAPTPPPAATSSNETVAAADASRLPENKKQAPAAEEPSDTSGIKAGPAGPGAKATKKSGEFARSASEGGPRRNAPRGSRVPGKEDRASAPEVPPSVQDPSLWPSIEPSASDDGKKQAQAPAPEKAEQAKPDEAGATKTRPKKEWSVLPVDHTIYNPPEGHAPHRGHARGRGGGRGGRETGSSRGGHNSNSTGSAPPAEKESTTPASFATKPLAEQPKPRDGHALPNRPPTQAAPVSKRGPTDSTAREPRKVSGQPSSEKPKGDYKGESSSQPFSSRGEVPARAPRPEFGNGNGDHAPNGFRRQSSDRRDSRAPQEGPVDTGVSHAGRGEGRSERGRGGFRGRGGGSAHNSMGGGHHQQPQQQQPGYGGSGSRFMSSNGIPPQQHQVPFSPTAAPFGGHYPGHGNGSGSNRRGPARAQTGPAHTGGQRHPHANGYAAPSRMPSMPLPPVPQDFHPVQPAYPPFSHQFRPEDEYIIRGLREQIEFYFSFTNMHRDRFLRSHMDSQGWVLLKVIADFKRVKQLAPSWEHIRLACAQSQEIDYVSGEDGLERLRARGYDYDSLIFPDPKQRAVEAQTSGPARVVWHNHDRMPAVPPYGHGYGHYPAMYTASPTNYQEFPRGGGENMYPTHSPMYTVNGGGHFGYGGGGGVNGGMNGGIIGGNVNGSINGLGYVNGQRVGGEYRLSAAVPDFSPIAHQRPSLEGFQQFQDADIPKLVIPRGSKTAVATTAENGVSSPSDEVEPQTDQSLANGLKATTTSPDGEVEQEHKQGTSPKKTKPESATGSDLVDYPDYRELALGERKNAAPGETPATMHKLYSFWVDLLSDTFNNTLYEEFRQLAIEDGTKQPACSVGVRYLLSFYDSVFNAKPLYPQEFDMHYHEAKSIADSWATTANGVAHSQ